jgi:uncharacterized membrane protein
MLHLIHPVLVHFGVAFVAAGAILESYGLLQDRDRARHIGGSMWGFGTIVLVAVIASGYVAANTIELPAAASGTLIDHERQGWILLAALVLLQFWKGWHRGRVPEKQRTVYALALCLAAALVFYSAWLGGRLVYGFGLGVGQ